MKVIKKVVKCGCQSIISLINIYAFHSYIIESFKINFNSHCLKKSLRIGQWLLSVNDIINNINKKKNLSVTYKMTSNDMLTKYF